MIISHGVPALFIHNNPLWLSEPKSLFEIVAVTLSTVVSIVLFGIVAHAILNEQQNVIVQKLTKGLPLVIEEVWYAGFWYEVSRRNIPLSIPNTVYFNPFKVDFLNANTDHLINGLIPAYSTDDLVGLYRITRHYRDPMDRSEEGKLVDLRLCDVVDKKFALDVLEGNEEKLRKKQDSASVASLNPTSQIRENHGSI
jgi:hypothetical protein